FSFTSCSVFVWIAKQAEIESDATHLLGEVSFDEMSATIKDFTAGAAPAQEEPRKHIIQSHLL
ncbi:MAG: hypothetical protein LBQ98_08935, partial [Nitrososphaerota archaeon]|nr:hypothetical protein [Nitrososphaerota archaeon]